MIIDIHAHIWGHSPEKHRSSILTACQRYGIDRVYVSGLQSYVSDEAEIEYLNRIVKQFMDDEPERIGGAVYLNPTHKNAVDVARRAIEDQGFEMIKLWVNTFADDPSVDPIMEYAECAGVPVLLHVFKKSTRQVPNETTGIHAANIARRHPKTKILAAHFGGSCYDGIPCVRDLPNVWCDLSGTICHGDTMRYAVEQLGAERILFGTDNAFLTNIGFVKGADLPQAQQELIFWKNAQKLLDRSFRL